MLSNAPRFSSGDTIGDKIDSEGLPGFSAYEGFRKSDNIEDRRGENPYEGPSHPNDGTYSLDDLGPAPPEDKLSRDLGSGSFNPRDMVPGLRRKLPQ